MLCCVREGMVIADRGVLQGLVLCLGGRDDNGQRRVTRSCVVFRRA